MAGHRYTAEVSWKSVGDYEANAYSREHVWRFDGGIEVPASASPTVVPLPYSSAEAVDPEEALVAAISSCHMLTFIDLARRGHVHVVAYEDKAEGIMERIARGRMAITKVILKPRLTLAAAELPDPTWLDALHEKAHELCFIANSVKCEIEVDQQEIQLVSNNEGAA